MLTDNDKCDIFHFAVSMTRDARSDYTHQQLVCRSVKKAVSFLIAHPDMCAAELNDFLNSEGTEQEFERLIEIGML